MTYRVKLFHISNFAILYITLCYFRRKHNYYLDSATCNLVRIVKGTLYWTVNVIGEYSSNVSWWPIATHDIIAIRVRGFTSPTTTEFSWIVPDNLCKVANWMSDIRINLVSIYEVVKNYFFVPQINSIGILFDWVCELVNVLTVIFVRLLFKFRGNLASIFISIHSEPFIKSQFWDTVISSVRIVSIKEPLIEGISFRTIVVNAGVAFSSSILSAIFIWNFIIISFLFSLFIFFICLFLLFISLFLLFISLFILLIILFLLFNSLFIFLIILFLVFSRWIINPYCCSFIVT